MGVSKNSGTRKSSILIGFSIINHLFWGTPVFGNTHIAGRLVETFKPLVVLSPKINAKAESNATSTA